MSDTVHNPAAGHVRASAAEARRDHVASLADPDTFWAHVATRIDWYRKPTKIKDTNFAEDDFHIRWFEDGVLNASVNCLDRHLERRGEQPALIFEADDPRVPGQIITYRELHARVCQLANVLRAHGVGRGDRVTIYLPMIPAAVAAMLACARVGAVHSVVFGGFSPHSIADRIADCGSKLVITADAGVRGGRSIPLKANVDAALELPGTECVQTVLVVRRGRGRARTPMHATRDHWLAPLADAAPVHCEPERMQAEDPLFILYTSGSTGKPKGVLHTTGGYLVYAAYTHERVFDLREDDVYWCTADVGWVTGHSYIVYGPLANGTRTLLFEGVPTYPSSSRFWEVIDRHRVTVFYTAPTALRALMREGDGPVLRTSRASLRLLGSVGEPINPEAWRWYFDVVGESRCPIVDTWWQTETGGVLIAPSPGTLEFKPGAAMQPLPGVSPAIVDAEGGILEGEATGNLVLTDSWPGQMRGVYGEPKRFFDTYFRICPGSYFTGDGCRRDAEGDWWITGRVDDVINVSGHRIGTAEVESALVAHSRVAEAAVVGFPHDIKGQGIHAFVTLNADAVPSEELRAELVGDVRREIGPFATPDRVQWAPALPKTRSGKIMRRILRKIAEAGDTPVELQSLGDTSTLADPSVVESLLKRG